MSPTVTALAGALRQEFSTLAYARAEFPMLTRWGVPDFSQTVHSLGCSYLCGLGRHLGHWAVTEWPVALPSPMEGGTTVRLDATWWDKEPGEPACLLAEFERIDGTAPAKLAGKARTLLAAHRALPAAPRLLLLMGWKTYGAPAPSASAVRQVMADGCTGDDGRMIKGLGGNSAFVFAVADIAVDAKGQHRLHGVTVP